MAMGNKSFIAITTTTLVLLLVGMQTVEKAEANFLPPPYNTCITIDFPQNLTYNSRTLNLNFTLQSNGYGWYWYKVDENELIEINVTTISEKLIDDGSFYYAYYRHTRIGNAVLYNLTDGTHRVTVFELGSNKQVLTSTSVYFTIDADDNAPVLSVFSNSSMYNSSEIPLTFAINEDVSWIGYSLDSTANITCNGNFTIKNVINGNHNVTIYANDTAGNMGKSVTVFFSVYTSSPTPTITPIATPSPTPSPILSPSISPTNIPTQQPTQEPTQTASPTNTEKEYYSVDYTPRLIIITIVALTAIAGLLVYFKKVKK
jgi:hypothetical protein